MAISYKDAGVDWQKGDQFIGRIKALVESTHTKEVKTGIGGFASLYDMGDGRLLVAGTDGVGTKLKVAQQLNDHATIGIDLVAMCVNDVICTGARPLFFLDYLATGKLDLETSTAVLRGIVEGCKLAGAALVGGETAEMPGMYQDGEYDLAGFCVGEVWQDKLVDGSKVSPGDQLVAIASTGVHSNGFSLVRKLFQDDAVLRKSLVPTQIYVKPVLQLLENDEIEIKGISHITGSGFMNVPRINKTVGYRFTQLPPEPSIYSDIRQASGLNDEELFTTFNMGTGMVLVTSNAEATVRLLKQQNLQAVVAGEVTDEPGKIEIATSSTKIHLQHA